MSLRRLSVQHVRNIESAELVLSPGVNTVVGQNGSGKTSLLESVYFLGTGRTFRSVSVVPLINRDQEGCLVRGELSDGSVLAVQRMKSGERRLRLRGEDVDSMARMAQALPTLVLGPETVNLVLGSPEGRRRFLNWGVFHVEHSRFQVIWERAVRSLRQRNRLLKEPHADTRELEIWSQELAGLSEQIDQLRRSYIAAFSTRFIQNCSEVANLGEVSVSYQPGWTGDLATRLLADLAQDRKRGFTQRGFQRADVKIKVFGEDAARTCSRGELKVLAWALILTQGDLVETDLVYLMDDLLSELDVPHRRAICDHLRSRERQVIATGIDLDDMVSCWGDCPINVFHVEHGVVSRQGGR
ncbi:MAG: DNA replication/repair protein RecF [Proteobacteria bacterium]|jgi:DNA replication and repair protein RecF|nr:DNA replication/repair protein RecF [Pseudomonadota bacterium]MDA1299980.1 DNA replication/repair protein RecF [Pseudomonadota bacterium]